MSASGESVRFCPKQSSSGEYCLCTVYMMCLLAWSCKKCLDHPKSGYPQSRGAPVNHHKCFTSKPKDIQSPVLEQYDQILLSNSFRLKQRIPLTIGTAEIDHPSIRGFARKGTDFCQNCERDEIEALSANKGKMGVRNSWIKYLHTPLL